MLIQAADRKHGVVSNMRGGEGEITWNNFTPEKMPTHVRFMGVATINPGCSVGSHQHFDECEIYFYLAGEATLDDNGTERLAHPGDISICYSGEQHGIANHGTEPVQMLAFVSTDAPVGE